LFYGSLLGGGCPASALFFAIGLGIGFLCCVGGFSFGGLSLRGIGTLMYGTMHQSINSIAVICSMAMLLSVSKSIRFI
jgi:hypothetical protein